MKPIRNVMIIGLGALGRIYAVKCSANPEIHLRVLADKERVCRYQREGIFFNGQSYSFDYITPEEAGFIADLIIVSVKDHALDQAIDSISHFVGPETAIISLLNGITSEDRIKARYPNAYVPYACYLGHISTRISSQVTHDGICVIHLGETDNTAYSKQLQRVTEFFDWAGIVYQVPQNMYAMLWSKFVTNIGLNQSSVVLDADYLTLQTDPNAAAFADHLMLEAVQVAKAEGVPETEKMLAQAHATLQQMPADAKSSMYQDLVAKRPMEIDTFGGMIVELGKKHGIPTPWNEAALLILRLKDSKNLA